MMTEHMAFMEPMMKKQAEGFQRMVDSHTSLMSQMIATLGARQPLV